ncbi:MAG: HAMP domain-containing histidine kinase [Burkholderiaceae bacterium]|nr:MAG: HAMP domain-containing histidine kinase [Burkholderiaceae bacterium]TAM01327.1 MAG: HAMP domain-containing histidine kinase [Pusillimonas sp.]
MRPTRSLRFKVALVFSALTILLLVSQALGVKTLAEVQEEKFITALISDDMASLIQSYRMDPTLIPPLDQRLDGHVSQEGRMHITLPSSVKNLQNGIHEIRMGGQEIHVAIASFDQARVYRIYDFSAYEKHFKKTINALMAGTGLFALLTIWLAFGLSGILVRQVARLARQVKAARLGASTPLNPGKYDEAEVADLVEAFNDYHHRMGQMIQREKEFTGNVSHEFRTPLTAIKTSCELLAQNAAMDTKSAARLRQIDRAADHMIELINVLLLLAREESSTNVGPISLIGAIKDALDPFADRLTTRGITLSIDIDSVLRVEVNRSALAIVLSNLIDNAVRHTELGRISFSYVDGRLRIVDTGRGIPQHDLAHVFERFYQARPAQEAGRTFGIGLAIVKKISDRYRWSIEIDSAPGKGTCVSLSLPRVPN